MTKQTRCFYELSECRGKGWTCPRCKQHYCDVHMRDTTLADKPINCPQDECRRAAIAKTTGQS